MSRPCTQKLLDTTACQRLKVMVRVACRDPDTGQKVSVRVRTPDNPQSAVCTDSRSCFFLVFLACFISGGLSVLDLLWMTDGQQFLLPCIKLAGGAKRLRSHTTTIFRHFSVMHGLKLEAFFVCVLSYTKNLYRPPYEYHTKPPQDRETHYCYGSICIT